MKRGLNRHVFIGGKGETEPCLACGVKRVREDGTDRAADGSECLVATKARQLHELMARVYDQAEMRVSENPFLEEVPGA